MAMYTPSFLDGLKAKVITILHSQVAIKKKLIFDGIVLSVSMLIVFFAKDSAGLNSGKNFKKPNQKYMILTLKDKILINVF
jgi:hypothetical protein